MTFTTGGLARLAGLSDSAVPCVMTGNGPTSEEIRRHVRAAVTGLTHQADAARSAPRSVSAPGDRVAGPLGSTTDT
ncbi:hypothetical protein [Auraticoccus monumenti]|uniref:Uncharacterized protein n=1 Tax=Auraticoccus monumenti TaxID=675864 RepID=A0A1G6S970_9ACTN|nr:hypothetical protein [Auraticoccus monumenti]SDD12695.1 hypothetical protein SAMN04489747_0244 [Auraticoccus monumenti]